LPASCDLSIEHLRQLVTCEPSLAQSNDPVAEPVGLIDDGCIAVSAGRVIWAGSQRGFATSGLIPSRVIDGSRFVAVPGLIDCHTHAVFAGSREREYEMRLAGKTYMEIAAAGGGIRSTVRAVRGSSEDQLAAAGLARVRSMLAWGATTIEIKSGYGLSLEAELKMLRAIRRVGEEAEADVVPTFLGAHDTAEEYLDRRGDYVDLVVEEMIPAVAEEKLAEFCDVFCERGVFSADESRRVLLAAAAHGLRPTVHADEFAPSEGAEVAAEVGAISAGHLLHASDGGLEAMRAAGTVAVLLPGVALGLGKPEFAPARKMLAMGLDVALATDFNPGSSMVHALPVVASLASSFMRLSPAEALLAMTRGAAKALGRERTIGTLARGKQADIALFDVPDFRYIVYRMAGAAPSMVLKAGRVAYERKPKEEA
jgi:imidazolonepropionase